MFNTNTDELNRRRNNRYKEMQEYLSQQHKQVEDLMRTRFQQISIHSKYKQHKAVIEQRKKMTNNFIKYVTQTFFAMLGDRDYVLITPKQNIINRVEEYKKNVRGSLQKLTLQLDGKREQEGENENISGKRSQSQGASKNKKISKQSSVPMLTFFIHNTENPYPSPKQKQEMRRWSSLDPTQINTWLTNYRDRNLKPLFQ